MEILYVYIDEYKKIKEQNINFGGKYRFHYDKRTKSLNVSENKQHIEGFYNKQHKIPNGAKITNVTSIIGENGVGKTSVLDFIYDALSEYYFVSTSIIFVVRNNTKIEVHSFDLEVILHHRLTNASFNLVQHKKGEVIENTHPLGLFRNILYTQVFQETSFIRFSNIFDKNDSQKIIREPLNITTNYLLSNDFYRRQVNNEADILHENQVDSFKFQEVFRQNQFIACDYSNSDIVPFELPEVLEVLLITPIINESQISNLFKGHTSLINNIAIEAFKKTLFLLQKKCVSRVTVENNFVERFIANVLLNYFVRENQAGISLFMVIQKGLNNFDNLDFPNEKSSTRGIIDFLEKLFTEIHKFDSLSTHVYMKRLGEFYDFIEKMSAGQDVIKNRKDNNEIFILNIPIDKEKSIVRKFMENYSDSYTSRPYLNFNWRNMSSGEQALLSMYSRFYSLVDPFDNNDQKSPLKQNLIILMDEPDTNLHPQWQKKMLNSLLEFFTEIYATKDGEQRNIQVIFTTNNPISASDLLSCNTVFMKLDTNKQMQIQDSLDDQRQTFGANIYSLYSDSFFIRDGLMGDFASEKINSVIKALNSLEDLSKEQREVMRRTILQIGEPAIKNKLIQMYSQRFQLDIHERLDKIEKKLDSDDTDKTE